MRLLLFIVLLIGCVIDNYTTNRALLIAVGKYPTILKVLFMKNRIIVFIISILLLGLNTTVCYAQTSISDIQTEMESLKHTARVFGKDSRLYNKQLLDLAFFVIPIQRIILFIKIWYWQLLRMITL